MGLFGATAMAFGGYGAACKADGWGCSMVGGGAAVGLMITGVALVGGGVVTIVLAPPKATEKPAARARWTPAVALGPAGGSLRWSF